MCVCFIEVHILIDLFFQGFQKHLSPWGTVYSEYHIRSYKLVNKSDRDSLEPFMKQRGKVRESVDNLCFLAFFYVCLCVCLAMFMIRYPEIHRKLWGGSLTLESRDAYLALLVYSGSISSIRRRVSTLQIILHLSYSATLTFTF